MQQLDSDLELPRPPRPLIESNPVPQPYPVQALGGILGPAVGRMAKVIGVPQALAAPIGVGRLGPGRPRSCGLTTRREKLSPIVVPDHGGGVR